MRAPRESLPAAARRGGRALAGLVTACLIVLILAVAGEAAIRVYVRVRTGRWQETQIAQSYDDARARSALFARHPFLNAAPKDGAHSLIAGREASFSPLGYRSADRPRAKSPGTFRILCSGGSTTFDLLAPDDAHTWPVQLERSLREPGRSVEVWNAGFPGWTSAENLISLAIRDVDLHPDVAILLQGFNDLQPASHEPFDPQYVDGHAREVAIALGLELPLLHWYERSLLRESLLRALHVPGSTLGAPPTSQRRDHIGDAALETFARNVRSYVAIASAHGAKTLLVTQPIRIRAGHRAGDLALLEWWIQGLKGDAVPGELERFNDVLRGLADGSNTRLADAARDVEWTDEDFGDAVHYSARGAAVLADYLAARVARILDGSS